MGRSEDGVTLVIFAQHKDRHELEESPTLRQAHFQSEHLDVRPQLQQPTKRSPHFDSFNWREFPYGDHRRIQWC